jgi:2-polyprenyl-3-methyl-5-hydroxy-6-metoxy-1,4-benzoquinol methylase
MAMSDPTREPVVASIVTLIDAIRREIVDANAPADFLRIYDLHAQEALITRQWLQPEIEKLPPGASILEIGGGMALVSVQLMAEGFDVTEAEPIGIGFPIFHDLQRAVMVYAAKRGFVPQILPIKAETLTLTGKFDFAFSSQTMEHVDDVGLVLERVLAALKPGASYRFNCPNYRFPYEPHFDIPTLVTKQFTERVFRSRILSAPLHDPEGLWRSVNWITVQTITRACRHLGVTAQFNRRHMASTLERVVTDTHFAARRSKFILAIVRPLVRLGLHRFATLVPASIQPVIDCRIERRRG